MYFFISFFFFSLSSLVHLGKEKAVVPTDLARTRRSDLLGVGPRGNRVVPAIGGVGGGHSLRCGVGALVVVLGDEGVRQRALVVNFSPLGYKLQSIELLYKLFLPFGLE